MSGGHFEYNERHIFNIADEIEVILQNDCKYIDDVWRDGRFQQTEFDRFEDATELERMKIMLELESLVNDLRKVYSRVREIDYYLSGDTGATSYLERLNKKKYNT